MYESRTRRKLLLVWALSLPILFLLPQTAQAAQVIYASGMTCDGTNPDTAGLNAAISQALASSVGSTIQLPAGRCILAGAILVQLQNNQAIRIQGYGRDITELVWNNASSGPDDGFEVTYKSQSIYYRSGTQTGSLFQLSDLSIIRGGTKQVGTGVSVAGDTTNQFGTVEPGTLLNNVSFHGVPEGGTWAVNLLLQNTANTDLDHVYMVCAAEAGNAYALGGIGVSIQVTDSQTFSTLHNFEDFN